MFSFFKKKPPARHARGAARRQPRRRATAHRARLAQRRRRRAVLRQEAGERAAGARRAGARHGCVVPATAPIAPASGIGEQRRRPPSRRRARRSKPTPARERSGWLAKLKSGLRKTGSSIAGAFVGAEIDDALYEDLEAALLMADAGVDGDRAPARRPAGARQARPCRRDPAAVRGLLADCIADLLAPLERPLVIGEHAPTVIMVVGVNGAGKTTSIGKLDAPPARRRPEGAAGRRRHLSRRGARAAPGLGRARRRPRQRRRSRSSARKAAIRPA